MDNFNMYQSYKTAFESLGGDQCKALILALFDHAAGQSESSLDPATQMAYLFITSQMDRDRAAYEKKCATNRAIAEKREARKRQTTNVHQTKRTPTGVTNTRTGTTTATRTRTISPHPPKGARARA